MSEQKTFKYLDQANAQGGDAAQDFLNKKMSGNRYMSVSNPDNPYSMGEGSTPSGAAYDSQRTASNQSEIDSYNKANPNGSSGTYGEQSGVTAYNQKRYNEGRWGAGELNAEDLAAKFGLDRTEGAASGENAIYGTNADGSKVFIGNTHKNMDSLTKNSELVAAHGKQAHEGEGNHAAQGDAEISSDGDVKGAILNLWKKDAAKEAPTPQYEAPATPIKHSPEIKQAKERVQSYEQDALSGKTSEEIFGKGEYEFDATQGVQAFGSTPANDEAASTATKSFLDKKVFDVKQSNKFEPSL